MLSSFQSLKYFKGKDRQARVRIEKWRSQIEAVQERENEYICKLKDEQDQIEQYKQIKDMQLTVST